MQKMTPEDFLNQIKKAYHQARIPTMFDDHVHRHRVRSTSGVQEDIVAYYIRSQADGLQVHIDQPITIRPVDDASKIWRHGKEQAAPKKTWYPDIVVVQRHALSEADGTIGTIIALVDVKTDLGWNREDEAFTSICRSLQIVRTGLLDGRHRPLPKLPPRRPDRLTGGAKSVSVPIFDVAKLRCADRMTCHVVVVTAANSGNIAEAENSRQLIASEMGVHLHVLLGLHPNKSKRQIANPAEAIETDVANIRHGDFKSLIMTILETMS